LAILVSNGRFRIGRPRLTTIRFGSFLPVRMMLPRSAMSKSLFDTIMAAQGGRGLANGGVEEWQAVGRVYALHAGAGLCRQLFALRSWFNFRAARAIGAGCKRLRQAKPASCKCRIRNSTERLTPPRRDRSA
jgi:hypothetical protein